ncbi:MAG: DUF3847 domain-containing protein [Oscillospiraceae bacterium]|nr:DUF3847 domain-containing protein [Oscillospiraceae bacterium]
MSQTKLERIENINEEIKNLRKRQQQLRSQHNTQERKARTKRLIERGAELESMMPDTATFTNEQFRIFLKRTTANDFGQKILAEMVAKNPAPPATPQDNIPEQDGEDFLPKPTKTTGHIKGTSPSEPADAVRDGSTGSKANGGAGARDTG